MTDESNIHKQMTDAYDAIADRFEEHAASSAHNAYWERPAMLSLLPDVKGMHALDAGSGAGYYAEWLVNQGAGVTAVDGSEKMVAATRRRLGAAVHVQQWDLNRPLDFIIWRPESAADRRRMTTTMRFHGTTAGARGLSYG